MNIKQLFCKHIWKQEKEEYLRSLLKIWYSDSTPIYKTDVYAVHNICIKCSKKNIVEVEGKKDYTV